MRHKKNTVTLDRKAGPRKAMLRSAAISLIMNEKITTTPTKAKAVRRLVERVITRGKKGDFNAIRYVERKLNNKDAALHVVNVLSPRFEKREGGYTRMLKVAPRKGDGAEQVVLEFVDKK